jgi:cytochrome c oxidase cbb3-type subunit 3/ubiquinol-cytochrome c reductase cytochrome c subunit
MKRLGAFVLALAACNLPGKPRGVSLEGQPEKVVSFDELYRDNCAGCHGEEGKGGAALGLANPVYLAIVDDATAHRVITEGVAGTAMPAFAKSAGGFLTDEQVGVIAKGLRARWANPGALAGATPPPYAGPHGDAERGTQVYATFCANCHGANGTGTKKASSIVDGSFLALVSAQGLRTTVIAGRPEIGQPDWRNDLTGRPLSSQEIADVVAWLESHRPEFPGQPYSARP